MRFHFVVGCAQSLNVAADQVSFAEQITGMFVHGLGDAVLAVPSCIAHAATTASSWSSAFLSSEINST